MSAEKSELTTRLLTDSADAAAEADAVLFCVNGPIKDDEADAVRRFKEGRGGTRLTGGTAVGVLTKVDQLGGDRRTAWKAGLELSQQMSKERADLFSVVLPVIGLLAETATSGAIREQHARALYSLAMHWNADQSKMTMLGTQDGKR